MHITARYDGKYGNLLPVAKILLENGADPSKENAFQRLSPIHLAVMKANLAFIKLLFDFRDMFDIRDRNDNNAIEFVFTKKQQDAMRMILFYFHQ